MVKIVAIRVLGNPTHSWCSSSKNIDGSWVCSLMKTKQDSLMFFTISESLIFKYEKNVKNKELAHQVGCSVVCDIKFCMCRKNIGHYLFLRNTLNCEKKTCLDYSQKTGTDKSQKRSLIWGGGLEYLISIWQHLRVYVLSYNLKTKPI